MNKIDPLEWMDRYCRELFEHIVARGHDRLYLDTGKPEKTWITVRQSPSLAKGLKAPTALAPTPRASISTPRSMKLSAPE